MGSWPARSIPYAGRAGTNVRDRHDRLDEAQRRYDDDTARLALGRILCGVPAARERRAHCRSRTLVASHLELRQVVAALLHLSDDARAASDNFHFRSASRIRHTRIRKQGQLRNLRERPLLARSGRWSMHVRLD